MNILPIQDPKEHISPAAVFMRFLAWITLIAGIFLAVYSASAVPSINSSLLLLAGAAKPEFEWALAVLIMVPTILIFAILLCLSELFENTARIAKSLEGFRLESPAPRSPGPETAEKAEESAS